MQRWTTQVGRAQTLRLALVGLGEDDLFLASFTGEDAGAERVIVVDRDAPRGDLVLAQDRLIALVVGRVAPS